MKAAVFISCETVSERYCFNSGHFDAVVVAFVVLDCMKCPV